MNIQDKVLEATANPNFRAPKCPEVPLSSVLSLQELFQGAAIDVPVAGIVVQAGMGSRSVGGQLVVQFYLFILAVPCPADDVVIVLHEQELPPAVFIGRNTKGKYLLNLIGVC